MSEYIANNAITSLVANVGLSDTTLSVASSIAFPSPNFRIVVDSELMLVTAVSGTTWTVSRGQESSTVAGHTNGASVANVLTVAGLLAAIDSDGSTITLTGDVTGAAGATVVSTVGGSTASAIHAAAVAVAVAGSDNGLATLNSSGQLNSAQIPAALVGAVDYQGLWNATTNSPTLVSSTGTKGNYYVVSTAGTTSINGIASWNVGDTIIFNGSVWDKIDGISSEVVSVAGRTGAVVLSHTDISGLANSATITADTNATSSTLVERDSSGNINATAFYGDGSNLTGIAGVVTFGQQDVGSGMDMSSASQNTNIYYGTVNQGVYGGNLYMPTPSPFLGNVYATLIIDNTANQGGTYTLTLPSTALPISPTVAITAYLAIPIIYDVTELSWNFGSNLFADYGLISSTGSGGLNVGNGVTVQYRTGPDSFVNAVALGQTSSFDGGAAYTDGSGNVSANNLVAGGTLTVSGTTSLDNGTISTNGSGTLTALQYNYSGGATLANNTALWYSTGSRLTNASGELFYGQANTVLSDASGNLYYSSGNKLAAGSGNGYDLFTNSGLLVYGVAAHADLAAQTGSVSSVCTFTPSAVTTCKAGGYVSVTAIAGSGTSLVFTLSWTDENGTSRTQNYTPMGASTSSITATGFYPMPDITIRGHASDAIKFSTNYTAGTGSPSISYDVGGQIEQLR